MDDRIRKAAKLLESEFGSDWMTVAQMLGTEDLRRRVGKELTSFMAFPERGVGGNNQWRGNCSPEVVYSIAKYVLDTKKYYGKDIKDFTVLDPMSGSGTTKAAVDRLGVKSILYDLNPQAPVGNDKEKWMIDEPAAEIVRKIYNLCLAGRGPLQIARQLEEEQILVPSAYYESIGRNHSQKVPFNPCNWDQKTVAGILENRQYTGCAVNFKSTTVSYKVHKKIYRPTDEQQIIPNMQEPIISEEQWLRVQELRKNKRRPTASGSTSLFSGLVYCADCGAKLHFAAAKSITRNQEHFRCSNYKSGRGSCSVHYIRDVVLEKIVYEAISGLADFVKCHETVFLYMLAKKTNAMRQKEYKRLQQAVEHGTKRIAEIDRLIEKVFEQNASGVLSDERFAKMLQNYENEQKTLTQEVADSQQTLQEANQKVTDLRLLLRTLREMTDITELTPTLVNSLIERIEVHNNDKSSGHCYVKVDIYFTAVGMIDIPTEQEIFAMMEEIRENPQDFRFVA